MTNTQIEAGRIAVWWTFADRTGTNKKRVRCLTELEPQEISIEQLEQAGGAAGRQEFLSKRMALDTDDLRFVDRDKQVRSAVTKSVVAK